MNMKLRFLGKRAMKPTDTVDLIAWKGERILVRLECAEFTSLCPVTRQPDFAAMTIEYVPARHLVETKSLKLYLWRYRNAQAFNEPLVDSIAADLDRQIHPCWLRVPGRCQPRGGIASPAVAERGREEYRPA